MHRGGRRRGRKRVIYQGQGSHHGQERDKTGDDDYHVRDVVERKNVNPQLLLGTTNLNKRHSMYFDMLSGLIFWMEKKNLSPVNRDSILNDVMNPGMHMEWCEKSDASFLWLSSVSEKMIVKLEILNVIESDLMELDDKHVQLAFSEDFEDGNLWSKTKSLLCEVFAPYVSVESNPDIVYAFTRVREKFHLHIFKIVTWSNEPQLSKIGASFVFKPESLYFSNERYSFVHESCFCIEETVNGTLSSRICHLMENHLKETVLLPRPPYTTEWEGFDVTPDEFFQRFHAFRRTEIMGTGPVPPPFNTKINAVSINEYYHLCLPFKIFSRSLFLRCEEAFAKQKCFEMITTKNIFFRGTELKILGAKLIAHSNDQAAKNVKEVGCIIFNMIKDLGLAESDFPVELKHVLFDILFVASEQEFDLEKFDLVKNNVCWMDSLEKIHMVDDLYDEFMYKMNPDEQMRAGASFPDHQELMQRLSKNWLLKEIYNCGNTDVKSAKQHIKQKTALRACVYGDAKLADVLFGVYQAFKLPRNVFHHFTENAAKYYGKVFREVVEIVMASEFSDIFIGIQEGMTNEWQRLNVEDEALRSSYERFSRYFPHKIQFKDEDKKN